MDSGLPILPRHRPAAVVGAFNEPVVCMGRRYCACGLPRRHRALSAIGEWTNERSGGLRVIMRFARTQRSLVTWMACPKSHVGAHTCYFINIHMYRPIMLLLPGENVPRCESESISRSRRKEEYAQFLNRAHYFEGYFLIKRTILAYRSGGKSTHRPAAAAGLPSCFTLASTPPAEQWSVNEQRGGNAFG